MPPSPRNILRRQRHLVLRWYRLSGSCGGGNSFRLWLVALHRDLQVAGDLAVQLHRNMVFPDLLQRLFERDLAAIDNETLGFELLCDIARGNRTEQMLVLADLALEYQLDRSQLRSQCLGLGLLLGRL